ncbi:MAG: YfhO family protein, partial [Pygmaiobacter sp.]
LLYLLLLFRNKQKQFCSLLLAFVMGFSVVYGVIHLAIGRFPQWDVDANYKTRTYDSMDAVTLPTDHFFRTDTYECYDNLGLFLNVPCIRSFNSTVTPSILEFYPTVGVKRDVSSKPELDLFALRGLLSVEYLLCPLDQKTELAAKVDSTGFAFAYNSGEYAVFRNNHTVPMGFTYDYYLLEEDLDTLSDERRGELLLRAILLTEEQAQRYGSSLTRLPASEKLRTGFDAYTEDCAARAGAACDRFTATRDGFTASITLKKDNLVFFSVPYDEGFRATVNGKPVEVLKVDNGLIAIPAVSGANDLTLTLVPKGLPLSKALTLLGIAVYLCYLLLLYKRRNAEKASCLVPLELRGYCPTIAEVDAFCAAHGVASLASAGGDREDATFACERARPDTENFPCDISRSGECAAANSPAAAEPAAAQNDLPPSAD